MALQSFVSVEEQIWLNNKHFNTNIIYDLISFYTWLYVIVPQMMRRFLLTGLIIVGFNFA